MKRYFFEVLIIPALVLAACSYTAESAVRDVLGTSTEAPVFLGCKTLSERELSFQFSLPVRVISLAFDPSAEIESIDEGDTVRVRLGRSLSPGAPVLADLLVEDGAANTLNVLVPFRARNDRIPRLLITELRTEYSKPKVEFVELRTIEAGNLGALRLFTAGNSVEEPVFVFPPVEVPSGEYIVVHLRTVDTEPDWVNETGDNLALSPGTEALPTARDFWVPESKKRLRKTDAVYLMDQDDRIIDAVFLSETPDSWWTREELARLAELFAASGAWLPLKGSASSIPGPADAVITKNGTTTRTICRDEQREDTNTAADWYITVNSGATTGKENNPNRYVPK